MKKICVFCGSSKSGNSEYMEAAFQLGGELAQREMEIIYGGASVGLMGALAKSALARGGTVTGIMPQNLVDMDVAHKGLTRLIIVESMHERKAKMSDMSDGFISLPGGIGTLEETAEVFTWMQLGLHSKPVALLNCGGYYNNLMLFLNHMVKEGFLRKDHLDMLILEDSISSILERMENFEHRTIDKWFDKNRNLV